MLRDWILKKLDFKGKIQDAYEEGYINGKESGLEEGNILGFNDGFVEGQKDGFDEGYARGLEDGTELEIAKRAGWRFGFPKGEKK